MIYHSELCSFSAPADFGSVTRREDNIIGRRRFELDRDNSTSDYMDEISGFDEDSTDWKCYRCEDCGQMFGTRSRMLWHREIHSGDKPYLCDDCGKSFLRRTTLDQHKLMHSGERPYMCDECGKSFTWSHVARHKLSCKRNAEKPYKCDQCGQSFGHRSSVSRHKRRHTGLKR